MTTDVGSAEPSIDSTCTGYLVPADIVHAWQHNQKLLEIDRPADKNVGDMLVELEQVVKHKDDVIPLSDKQMLEARKLGDFLTSKKTRGVNNVVVSHAGLPPSTEQTDSTQMSEEKTLASIPGSYIPKARKILQAWREKGMTWDEDGNVYLNRSPVLGADLGSLLRHTATQCAATPLPAEYEPIFQHMDSQRLPRSMYVNPMWRKPTLDSGGDPFESGSERGDIAGAEGYTLPPSFVPTTQDSKPFDSFLPSPE